MSCAQNYATYSLALTRLRCCCIGLQFKASSGQERSLVGNSYNKILVEARISEPFELFRVRKQNAYSRKNNLRLFSLVFRESYNQLI